MPANLPPEYYEAEKKLREASTSSEKIAALEQLISKVPKHKGTDKIRADLRRRLSRLRDEAARKKKGGRGDLLTVPREGAAQFALVGFANSGKSSLVAALTNARPVVAEYPVSTVMPLSGMMPYENIRFQLVDLPPVGNESTDGWVSGLLRTADALMLVVDLSEDPDVQAELLLGQLGQWNIPVSGAPEGGEKKAFVAASKLDLPGADDALSRLKDVYGNAFPVVGVSADRKEGLEELKSAVFGLSGVVRVYTKEPGKEADLDKPFTLASGTTVSGLARSIHKDFETGLKYACIWGSAKFPGQRVQKDHVLRDGDIVEIHVR
jgi:ribosome-interacting GTPase 1